MLSHSQSPDQNSPSVRRARPNPSMAFSRPISSDPHPSTQISFREMYLDSIERRFPEFIAQNDFEIFRLGSSFHKAGTTTEDVVRWLKEQLDDAIRARGTREDVMLDMKHILDSGIGSAQLNGGKPRPGSPDIWLFEIAEHPEHRIRLWPGRLDTREFCMDFVETATALPLNSSRLPFKVQLWSGPPFDTPTPWLYLPPVKIESAERCWGMDDADILAGAERFYLMDGMACTLRYGETEEELTGRVEFNVPLRKLSQ